MGLTLLVVFVVGLALGLPVAFVMGGAGLLALVVEGNLSLLSVPQRFFNGINSFPLMAVPFFILAADLMSASAITTSILRFTNGLVGHIRGGLGHVNVLTNMVFAGISGSALADAAGPGAILMRMMQRAGYESTTRPRCQPPRPPSGPSSRRPSSWSSMPCRTTTSPWPVCSWQASSQALCWAFR